MVSSPLKRDSPMSNSEINLGTQSKSIIKSATIDRENSAHEAFAKYLTEQFHYVETKDYYNTLDAYCTEEQFTFNRPPLVVLGQSSSGKSSLLANWARYYHQLDKNKTSHLIFQHYAGSTYDSVKLSMFLYRIMHKLKHACDLKDFELPNEYEEEKLKFSFVRCLEAATKARGNKIQNRKIIVIIDGIDNLRTSDGLQSLTWVPKDIPLGVKLILSATKLTKTKTIPSCRYIIRQKYEYDSDGEIVINSSSDSDSHDSEVIQEFQRRNCSFFHIEALDESLSYSIINKNIAEENIKLTKREIDTILDARGSSCPRFLRLLIQFLGQVPNVVNKMEILKRLLLNAFDIKQMYLNIFEEWNIVLNNMIITDSKVNTKVTDFIVNNKGDTISKSKRLAFNPRDSSQGVTPSAQDISRSKMVQENLSLICRHAMSLFAVTRNGLSFNDFHNLLCESASKSVRDKVWSFLSSHLMRISRHDCDEVLYALCDNPLRVIIRTKFLNDDMLVQNYHKEMVTYISKFPSDQRRIDELPVHLEFCGLWSQLLSTLVDIPMFLVWWTEKNQEDFIQYWIVVRNHCSNLDPAEEFIRSLEEFLDEDLSDRQLILDLLKKITNFLRKWQVYDERTKKPTLRRPVGPQLRNLISCHGTFSPIDMSNENINHILNTFSMTETDTYFVRRWLWVQYPLIALAFEDFYLEPLFKSYELKDVSAMLGIKKEKESQMKNKPQNEHRKKRGEDKDMPESNKLGIELPPASGSVGNNRAVSKKVLMKSPSTKSTNHNVKEPLTFEFLSSENEESKITVSKLREQIRELRIEYDKVNFDVKEKQKIKARLDSQLLDAKAEESERSAGAQKLNDILKQMQNAARLQAEGKQRSKYCRLILRQCELLPARDPNIIEVAEKNVRQMRQDIVSLKQESQVLGYETKLSQIEIPKLKVAIAEQTQTHKQAIYRLKWRHVQSIRQHEWDLQFRLKSVNMRRKAQGDLDKDGESEMIARKNERVSHLVKTAEQKRKARTLLGFYIGSVSQPGIFDILRNAGIHSPDEILLRWNDMFNHQDHLRKEKLSLEEKLNEQRKQVTHLKEDLQALKFGGNSEKKSKNGSNLRDIEARMSELNRTLSLKMQRISHFESLFQKLRLGLVHIIKLLGMDMKSNLTHIEIVNYVEQGVRKLIGEEIQTSSSSSNTLRRLSSQKNLKSNKKSIDERAKLNRRIYPNKQKEEVAFELHNDNEIEDIECMMKLRKSIKGKASKFVNDKR